MVFPGSSDLLPSTQKLRHTRSSHCPLPTSVNKWIINCSLQFVYSLVTALKTLVSRIVTDAPPLFPLASALLPPLPPQPPTHKHTRSRPQMQWRGCDNYLGWHGLRPMRRGTLRGGYVLKEGKASCYSSTWKVKKQNNNQLKNKHTG